MPFNIVLLDEIEKANSALFQLFLNVLDKGKMTLGNRTEIDFTKSIIIMTSNLGASQIQDALSKDFGFKPKAAPESAKVNQLIAQTRSLYSERPKTSYAYARCPPHAPPPAHFACNVSDTPASPRRRRR
jgi:ATP-dependent Clp protease ATP-binding subunit ClpA